MKRPIAPILIAGAALLFGVLPGSARANISFVNMFRNNSYEQTGNGASLSPASSFFTLGLFSTATNEFTSVQATYPGPGSPVNLSQVGPMEYRYDSGLFPNQAAMDAAYPFGTYAFSATPPVPPPLVTSFDYSADAYSQTLPYLAGTSFSDLQGFNAAAPFTIQFSQFTPDPSADDAILFFTVFDAATNMLVYDAGFLPSTTTSLTLPADTLNPGTSYIYELDFSDRVFAPSPGADFDAQIGFDLRTDGAFFTAVPEPGVTAMLALGVLSLMTLKYSSSAHGKSA